MEPKPGLLQFADAVRVRAPEVSKHLCDLTIRQQPVSARVAIGKEKDRKPIDPPSIIQLRVPSQLAPVQSYITSPYCFLTCSLIPVNPPVFDAEDESTPAATVGSSLMGTVVSSLHRLKDVDKKEAAFFIFGELYVKTEGKFRLQFNLYETFDGVTSHLDYLQSEVFMVYGTRSFAGMAESTALTKALGDQGVRLRIHKAPRSMQRKTGPANANGYIPRKNKKAESDSPEDESVESEEVRHSQDELQGSMHQIQSPSSFERDPGISGGRGYSYHSSESFNTGYADEPFAKRPRMTSEQSSSPSFGQQGRSPEVHQYAGNSMTGSQPGAFQGLTQQQQQFRAYEYIQSPVVTTPGEHYATSYSFAQQSLNSIQHSPHTPIFFQPTHPTFQAQAPQPFMTPPIPNPDLLYDPGRSPFPPAMIGHGQGIRPTGYGRSLTSPEVPTMSPSTIQRTHSWDLFQNPGLSVPVTPDQSLPTTSAPPGNFHFGL